METELSDIAKRLKSLDRSDIKNWLKRGELLTSARNVLGNDAGFANWCREQGIAKTTAYKSMAAFRDFGSVSISGQFSKESMAILSRSPEAREDAIDLAKHKRISAKTARELVAAYLPPASKINSTTGGTAKTLTVPGGFVIVKAESEITDADILAMLAHAARSVKASLQLNDAA